MKKLINIIIIMIFLICILLPIVKAESTYTISLEVTKNKNEETFELYILLPLDYITYTINKAGLDIEYTGPETLIENEIPGIEVEKSNVQEDTYSEDGLEYVQILLEPDSEGLYKFNIIEDYPYMDMKLRIKNDEKDYIMHINNFDIENGVCKIEYNYDDNEIKQPTRIKMNFATLLLIIILIVIIIIAIISKIETRKNK